ncbi:hypothetical protein [Gemmatimonas sp.]|uniref:hypothetical protein n=1 Tax=Gemmatimonas sp. TaxID=1962908 RepID=UPI00286A1E3D|nr:hypothetical protein [Gemmatimonas sp.]
MDELLPAHLVTENARLKRVETWEGSTERHHDLDWVANCWDVPTKGGYYTRRSAFWRVSRRVANQVCPAPFDDNAWSSTLAWTNLYQVAPLKRGNPAKRLRDPLRADSVHLLESDVTRLGPKRLLVLAGHDWAAPFFMHGVKWSPNGAFVQGSGRWTLPNGQSVAVVVAKHPQGKPEDPMVSDVVAAFSKIDLP